MNVAESVAAVLPPACFAGPVEAEAERRPRIEGRAPEAVVRPGSGEEVAALLAWAGRERVGVLPLASGRRARPVTRDAPYVVLATDRLAGIEIYEPADLTLTAGAGTPFSLVDASLRAHRQWAPFDPPSVGDRSLGGLVATGDSGPLWMGYGELRNHVLGATVVTGDGRTVRLGGRVVKNVAGFDVLKLMVGGRGSLGVITSICLRAFPLPTVDRVLVLSAPAIADLIGAAARVSTAPVLPVSSVLLTGAGPSNETGSAATLVVRLHGARETVDADQATLERHVGVGFEVVERARPVDFEGERTGTTVVVATCLASELGRLVDALARLDVAVWQVDAYGARARVALDGFDEAALARARDEIEAMGGALRVEAAPPGADRVAVSSRPNEDEAGLTDRLRETFDPEGVLWPTHW